MIIEIDGKVYETKRKESCAGCVFSKCGTRCPPPVCRDTDGADVIWNLAKPGTIAKLSKMVAQ